METKKSSFLEIIKYIYVYFFSAVGTVMIIMGIYKYGEFVFSSSFGTEYKLDAYREEQCDLIGTQGYGGPYTSPVEPPAKEAGMTKAQIKEQKKLCEKNLAKARAYQKRRDFFDASMLTGLGLLVFALHFGWMRKKFLKHE